MMKFQNIPTNSKNVYNHNIVDRQMIDQQQQKTYVKQYCTLDSVGKHLSAASKCPANTKSSNGF